MAAPEPPSEEAMVAQVVQVLVSAIGIKGRVEVSKDRDGYLADVRTRRSGGLLIGHRGSTLRAIQHVARAIVRKRYPDVPPINVDVGGYRLRREGFLRKKATAVARIVIETKREMALDFLTERELEVVRDAIVELPVRAYAVGTGSRRNVVIAPVLNQ
jgi:spoIIIJ-associated protein